jgi:hypothetical protein
MADMAATYEGPTRAEILLQTLKYNNYHHKVDNILVSNASKASDLTVLRRMVQDEANASESAKQINESLKELQHLRRVQLKKGPASSRGDWVNVRSARRRHVETDEKGIAVHDAKTAAAQAQGKQKSMDDLSKRVMKPTLPSSPKKEVRIHKPPPSLPQPVPTIRYPGLSKKVMKPNLPSSPKKEVKTYKHHPQRP